MNPNQLLSLTRVRKAYNSSSHSLVALNNINLTINNGEFLSIMGPSGSGKSTLLNILGLLDTFDSGEYILDNKQTRELSDKDLAEIRNTQIGFVFQTFNLLPQRNALENTSLPLYYRGISFKERNKKAMHFLEKMGIADWSQHLPDELSGGQKQRVAIARALCADPKLILADEPTGALDTQTSAEIMDLLGKINETGKTIVVVTHEHEIAQRTKRKVLLVDGDIVDDTLLTPQNKYR